MVTYWFTGIYKCWFIKVAVKVLGRANASQTNHVTDNLLTLHTHMRTAYFMSNGSGISTPNHTHLFYQTTNFNRKSA